MSKFVHINFIFSFCCLSSLSTQAYGKTESLLSRLYQKAQTSNRPLIVILDNSYLKEIPKHSQKHHNLLLSSEENHFDSSPILSNLIGISKHNRHKKPIYSTIRQRPKTTRKPRYNKKNFRSDTSYGYEGREISRSPIVKSLLRISNDLRCEANDECRDLCKEKFSGVKKQKCVYKCEVTYVCKMEEVDECKSSECEINSCESNDCEEPSGSTKGYTISKEARCKNGRC